MTADNNYAVSPREYNARADHGSRVSTMDAILAVASTGPRLSLILNAVGTGMSNPDCDFHNVAKQVSLFSLMLKEIAGALGDGKHMASQAAVNVVSEISQQGQLIFDEIKSIMDLSQGKDEKGILRSITIAEKNRWSFKKYKVQYLLGQLEALKLSLAIILQVMQMGKAITDLHQDQSPHALAGKAMMQDRAEIQNMIVVQHWSLVELRKLYQLAENEAHEESLSPSSDDPPPRYDEHRTIEPSYYSQKATEGDLQISIMAPPVNAEDTSKAIVKYQERPIQLLDAAFTKSLVRENQVLGANVHNIVDHLLQAWTQIPELDSQAVPRDRRPSLTTYYESEEDDTTESEYEDAHTKGRLIEGPRVSERKVKKDVRFQARVESDSDNEAQHKPHRRAPRKHVLHSETDTSSDSEASPVMPRAQPVSRRGSEASSARYSPNGQDLHDRNSRPYASTGKSHRPESIHNSNSFARPNSRGIPQPPMGPMPTRSMPNVNQWQGAPPPIGLRLPSYQGPPGSAQRPPSRGPYVPPGYIGHSPQPPQGMYFPQQQRPQGPPPAFQPVKPPRPRRHRHRSERQKAEEDIHAASKNIKRGLFGGAALAGIVDLLQGLDGI